MRQLCTVATEPQQVCEFAWVPGIQAGACSKPGTQTSEVLVHDYVSEVLVHEARDICTSGPGHTVSLDIKTLKPFKPPPLNALSQSQSQNPSKPRRLKPKPLKAKPPFGAPGTPLSRAEQPEVLTSLALSSLLRGLATGTLVSTAMEVRSSVSMHWSEEARRCSERRVRKPDLNPKPLP